MARFFIDRPVFAWVIAIIIMLAGGISILNLPISQYPSIAPPTIGITAQYPGASAQTVQDTVTQVIEQNMNGLDYLLYMSSTSDSSGQAQITLTFSADANPDIAQVQVQNKLQLATPLLPQEVQRQGISVAKRGANFLKVYAFVSEDGSMDNADIADYVATNLKDAISRISGVGEVSLFGSQYGMRIWLDPHKLQSYKLMPSDVINAINAQNAQVSAGQLGGTPSVPGQQMNLAISVQERLQTPEQFGNVILRTNPDGSLIRVKDVARVELGSESYSTLSRYNGKPATGIAVKLATGANALETASNIDDYLKGAEAFFPQGLKAVYPFDTTPVVKISIHEVVKTLGEAVLLVFLVMYLFLQNWRATLIPCLAVPVSIVGTFAGMYALGFSINTLTMFGLVLAIGIVVDDAIVVLENVERHISDGLPPRKATAKAMQEVTGPVIAIVLVLCAVFIPVAFTGGMAGRMYQQFAITIAVSVVISGAVALTFTPALCALLLKPGHGEPNVFFRKFNGWFEGLTGKYVSIVKLLLRRSLLAVGLFVLVLVGIGGVFERVPGGLVPDEDQGYLIALMTMPDGAAISRTSAVVEKLDKAIMADPLVADVMSFSGMDAVSGAAKTNVATFFFTLKPWGERKAPGDSSFDLARKLYGMGFGLEQGSFIAFNPPPISGMSNTGGFEMWLQDRNGRGSVELSDVAQKLAEAANKRPELQGVSTSFTVNAPQLFVELDREKARTLGVNVSDVFQTMQATFGSSYINDFNLYGRTFRVYTQSEKDYRARPEDLAEVYVRNKQDEMIPLTALINVKPTSGPQTVERFNNFQAAKFMGNPATGYSSGQAMMEEVAKEVLPDGYTIAWSGSSYQEKLVSSGGSLVFVLALVMVFLILAAQYESWSLPLTVLTAVPFGVLGAITAIWLRGISNDVYFQVALVTLIGLSAKNAILIVEFAVEQYRNEGKDAVHAAEEAARLRFRPIVMTSLAFILGCVPLAVSTGAGAASRHAIGTSVIGGMLVATLVAPLFVPFFFRWIMRASEKLMGTGKKEE